MITLTELIHILIDAEDRGFGDMAALRVDLEQDIQEIEGKIAIVDYEWGGKTIKGILIK